MAHSAALCSNVQPGTTCPDAWQESSGINEMFRLADENSQSIQTYKTGKEAADEALKAAGSQRLPDIGASLVQLFGRRGTVGP